MTDDKRPPIPSSAQLENEWNKLQRDWMQYKLDWFQYQIMQRFHPAHIPTFPYSTLGKVFGDIRPYEKRIDDLAAALERILELAERSDAHPELPIADIARSALNLPPDS